MNVLLVRQFGTCETSLFADIKIQGFLFWLHRTFLFWIIIPWTSSTTRDSILILLWKLKLNWELIRKIKLISNLNVIFVHCKIQENYKGSSISLLLLILVKPGPVLSSVEFSFKYFWSSVNDYISKQFSLSKIINLMRSDCKTRRQSKDLKQKKKLSYWSCYNLKIEYKDHFNKSHHTTKRNLAKPN